MKRIPIEGEMVNAIVKELSQSRLFTGLGDADLRNIALAANMLQYDPGETVFKQSTPSDSFFLIVGGEVIIMMNDTKHGEAVEITRVEPYDTIGEVGLILNQPRNATVVAGKDTLLLQFDKNFFSDMFKTLPEFGLVTCRVLATRLQTRNNGLSLPAATIDPAVMDKNTAGLLPFEFIQRHRVLPLKVDGNLLELGCVDAPTPLLISLIKQILPSMTLRPKGISIEEFTHALQNIDQAGGGDATGAGTTGQAAGTGTPSLSASKPPSGPAPRSRAPELDALLQRMVAEGASDVHLAAGHVPYWRIDGDMAAMPNTQLLDKQDVLKLTEKIIPTRNYEQFKTENDTDFAYAIPGLARFRVNLFRDHRGAGAVFRQIPDKILTIEQLGLPPAVTSLCDYPKGLILVTGPTGSGKSTTLAAMIDHINNTRKAHVITLEDPIEFVHESKQCLVNQREVGAHTTSFARALRAALREDPDIVLVGEMRDLETVALALETANTGHLVFGTLHTATAITTVARMIDMFPADQQNQVRTAVAESLKGVVAQTLCRKQGGGRIAALEILIPDTATASLIRDGKTHQIMSTMQTGKARGNRLLNEELARYVQESLISREEAFTCAVDKEDLSHRMKQIDANAPAQQR